MLQNSRGVLFLRVLKRRRQRNTHAPCWETPKPTKVYEKMRKKRVTNTANNQKQIALLAGGEGGSPPQRKVCETLKQSNRNRKLSGGKGGGPDPSAERTKNTKKTLTYMPHDPSSSVPGERLTPITNLSLITT